MASLDSKLPIIEAYQRMENVNAEICELLFSFRVIQHVVQDIPQFERGAVLPDEIEVVSLKPKLAETLKWCIEPQPVHRFNINMPKRFAGVLQLQASIDEYRQVMKLVVESSLERDFIIKAMKDLEPNSRKRGALTKKLFPDILYQTLTRKVPIAPFGSTSVMFSWCEEQKSVKKLSIEQAKVIVEAINSSAPAWQAQKNINKLEEFDFVYKATNVRVHPQAVIKSTNTLTGQTNYMTKKVYSPVIVISDSNEPIRVETLKTFKASSNERHWLKGYKPLIEGSCLVYKLQL
ncbi:DNA replication terminus site-binding protein [Enterovibrio norvegicus]|uniref:DNA replication terminus site-binding protein n=1 Tax=Enterovibrio norvegicus TaxID=188144 RepID=UPI000C864327|nr:DNA replication terminus site-binding protein [Enterovibrio norvegicus]PMH64537.1 hypothetical protein BCU62_15900 [Enterovibrio norvegicus]